MSEEEESNSKKITVEHLFKRVKDDGETEEFTPTTNQGVEDPEDNESLRKKLQERNSQLAALALKEFEKEKTELLELIEPEKREKTERYIGNDPSRLEQLKFQYGVDDESEGDGSEPVPPKGKVKAPNKNSTQIPNVGEPKQYENQTIQMISELFDIVGSDKSTSKEKAVAEQKIDSLYKEIARGRGKNPNFKTIKGGAIMTCPSCGHVVQGVDLDEGGTCPYCGWKREGVKTQKIRFDFTMKPK